MDSEEKVVEATILLLTKTLADTEEQLLTLAKNTKQLEDHVAAHPERGAELSP
jgi:ribosomal protein S15P/S13E